MEVEGLTAISMKEKGNEEYKNGNYEVSCLC